MIELLYLGQGMAACTVSEDTEWGEVEDTLRGWMKQQRVEKFKIHIAGRLPGRSSGMKVVIAAREEMMVETLEGVLTA